MHYKAIMFDLDGTLLPINQDEFVKEYFKLLAKDTSSYLSFENLYSSTFSGLEAMVKNDGTTLNKDIFWNVFEKKSGISSKVFEPICDNFYRSGFKKAKTLIHENPLAKKAIDIAYQKADKVILATNPVFPLIAQETRLNFIDLKASDFDYVTCYENEGFSKPNPKYYLDICEKFNCNPEECLMIGNDEYEDMYASSMVGFDTYLVLGYEILSKDHPYSGKKGGFKEMIEMLEGI